MYRSKSFNTYEEDCIHLHACRRLSKIVREKKGCVTRFCNSELCRTYQDVETFAEENELYPHDKVQYAINCSTEDALRGYTDNLVSDYI